MIHRVTVIGVTTAEEKFLEIAMALPGEARRDLAISLIQSLVLAPDPEPREQPEQGRRSE